MTHVRNEAVMTDLTAPIFNDEDAARAHFEAIRWPNGPVCPHCGVENEATLVKGKSHRPGMYQCNACREPFTVKVGSVMESSHIPMHKWALGFHLMAASKKGMSAQQLHRMLGITYKSAWFMAHRIREAMADTDPAPLGGKDVTVEVDETYINRPSKVPQRFVNGRGWVGVSGTGGDKMKVVTLVERGGRARSIKVESLTAANIMKIVTENASKESGLMTDEARFYPKIGREFASHSTVPQGKGEYVRGLAHTNTVEGFFSIFKRGMRGVYQHCGDRHLHRYLAEFDFRYSNRIALGVDDVMRAERAIRAAADKRLTYKQSSSARAA
jgi:transposase-like protein